MFNLWKFIPAYELSRYIQEKLQDAEISRAKAYKPPNGKSHNVTFIRIAFHLYNCPHNKST